MRTALTACVVVGSILLAWRKPPAVVAAAAVLWVLVGRTFTTTVIFPSPLLLRSTDFLDFLLIPLALLATVFKAEGGPRRALTAVCKEWAGLSLAAVALLVVCVVSSIANHLSVVRGLADFLFLVEPFMLLVAVVVSRPSPALQRRLSQGALWLVIVEFLTMTAQAVRGIAFGPIPGYTVRQDYVTGTMFGSRVGAHVLPAAVLLLTLVVVATTDRLPRWIAWALPALSIVFLILADDKQMLLMGPVVLVVFWLLRTRQAGSRPNRQVGGIALAGMLAVLVAATVYVMSFGQGYGVHLISKTLAGGGKETIDRQVLDATYGSWRSGLIGSGPGDTVSRLASLSLPTEHRAGSPTAVLHLKATPNALHYDALARQLGNGGTSDLLAPSSSFFGLIGDLGTFGALAYLALWVFALRPLVRLRSRLRPVAFAGWVALVPLAVVFDWAEQPGYTTVLALITALAISGRRGPGNATAGRPSQTRAISTTRA